jgi:hypothetical protein
MSFHIRPRSNGRTHELRIKHPLLPRPFYSSFDSEAEARDFAEKAERILANGHVPESLQRAPKLAFSDLAGAIAAYLRARAAPATTTHVLATVSADIGTRKLNAVDYRWAEDWVRSQKLAHHRAPGTIRHHVGALARCLDWVVNRYPTYLAKNPLRQLPRGYASYNDFERKGQADLEASSFAAIWRMICVPLIDGEESSQYLIDRSLMRPRNLIELLGHCRGFAVNLRHEKITAQDVGNGLKAYSSDLLRDINLEIRDVLPSAADAPYGFIGAPASFGHEQLMQMLRDVNVHEEDLQAVYEILLWYAFLGVAWKDGEAQYIYSFSYDFKLFMATINRRRQEGLAYQVNPAFWAALGISPSAAT